jgi:hypothetical protein
MARKFIAWIRGKPQNRTLSVRGRVYIAAVDEKPASCAVKRFDGVLRFGDLLAVEDDPADATKVQSIQLFPNVCVNELEPNHNALLCLGRPIRTRLRPAADSV